MKTIQCYELNFLHISQDADDILEQTLNLLVTVVVVGEMTLLSAFPTVLPKSLSFNCAHHADP